MTTYKRICIEDRTFVDEDKTITLRRGGEYITSEENKGTVVVFSNYWFVAPIEIFAGAVRHTGR